MAGTLIRIAMVGPDRDERAGGMRDYTNLLCDALTAAGAEITRISSPTWSLSEIPSLRAQIRRPGPDLVHVQHPLSYGRRLAPQVLAMGYRAVATIHEASIFGRVESRALVAPFTVGTRKLIFTSAYERRFVEGWAPWTRRKATVISVPSNIPVYADEPAAPRQGIVHFGVVRPGKGIEDVLELARILKDCGTPRTVRIVGETQYPRYANRLKDASRGLPVEWISGLSAEDVARELGRASVAYFPFPDGISERRSTLLAAMGNGAAVVTTAGAQTTEALRGAVCVVRTPDEAIAVIDRLLEDDTERERIAAAGRRYYAALAGWPEVARRHMEVYRELLGR
jgi:glycosyltransferase involved in cell wall biosynthesis